MKIRWLGDRPLPAQLGRELVGQLEVIAARSGRLENFQVGGVGRFAPWTPSHRASTSLGSSTRARG